MSTAKVLPEQHRQYSEAAVTTAVDLFQVSELFESVREQIINERMQP